ncbi:hypothetical protein DPX16_20016 [Anabarilius grahami]|uniref:Uncharacterized protein n=1 Tax=Anabarilius grahami TaxID=495550 RepID=A0A3N0Z4R4_ANAGA|nr:hypothetical protein DPX16_20016 [Anabarilius grahami]
MVIKVNSQRLRSGSPAPSCGSLFTAYPAKEDITSPPPDPERSQSSALSLLDQKPEPTADWETESVTRRETKTVLELKTEAIFIPQPELHRKSDQVHEPATTSCEEGILMEYDFMGWSLANIPAIEVSCISAGPAQLQVFCVFADPAQLHVSCVSDDPTQPPSPASTTQDRQFFSPAFTGSLKFLGIFNVSLLRESAWGLSVASSTLASGSPVSASGHQAHHSTLACRPVGSTLAPPPSAPPWPIVNLPDQWTSGPSAAHCAFTPTAPSWSSVPTAVPQSSGTLTLPQLLVTVATPWPPGPMVLSVSLSPWLHLGFHLSPLRLRRSVTRFCLDRL